MFLLIYTQFSETIYYIDAGNVYHRGPWYPVLLVPPVLIMVVNLIGLLRRRRKLSARQRLAFNVYLLLPMACMLIQMLFYGLFVIVLGTCLAAFFMFTYILMDQTERFYRQEAEIAKMKVDILMAQIKPHFIYNSLVAMRSYLDEPEKAEEVLTVAYEIEDSDFDLPAFSVQTLVENAVRHEIRESETGRGTVRIKSYRTDTEHVVEVRDDGVGFLEDMKNGFPDGAVQADGAGLPGRAVRADTEKPAENGDRAHIGLSNLQKCLSLMCGGWLEIRNIQEKETVVRMKIPVKKEK